MIILPFLLLFPGGRLPSPRLRIVAWVTAFAGGVILLLGWFRPHLASMLTVAALFNPLRRRIQDFIERRFYRGKYDVRKTLEAFSSKLRYETDLAALRDDLVIVVRRRCSPLTSRCGCARIPLQREARAPENRVGEPLAKPQRFPQARWRGTRRCGASRCWGLRREPGW